MAVGVEAVAASCEVLSLRTGSALRSWWLSERKCLPDTALGGSEGRCACGDFCGSLCASFSSSSFALVCTNGMNAPACPPLC